MILNAVALKDWRETRGLSLSELAVEAEVSLSYLSELEKGIKKPSAKIIGQLADALRVNVYTLISNPNEPTKAKSA